MPMSVGGNEGFFKLAETAAPREDRIMPAERTYAKSSATVGLEEAISLMKKRRENPDLKIQGGLDDVSENVRIHSQKKTKAPEIKEENTEDSLDIPEEPQEESPKPMKRGKVSNSAIMEELANLKLQNERLQRRMQSLKSTMEDKGKETSDKRDGSLEMFMSGNHKVTFMLNEMEFTVRCLNMIKDDSSHCLVLAFPEEGDSFFTPPMQSELSIKYDGVQETGKLFYFGMCFTLKELKLRFLGFLYDENHI